MRQRWSQLQDGDARARPAVADDVVYFGAGDGSVFARDVQSGATRWRTVVAPGQPIKGATLVVQSGVLVVPVAFETVGLDAVSGRVIWRYSAPIDSVGDSGSTSPGLVNASHPAADAQSVYIPAWGASVSAVDLASGGVRWVWTPGPSAGDTAVTGRFRSGSMGVRVSGDTVFATVWHFLDAQGLTSEPWLVALDRTNGAELWRVVLPSYSGGTNVWGAPALYGNLVIVGTAAGVHAWAIDRATRQVVWHFAPSNPSYGVTTQVEVAGGLAFVDGGDDFLYALDAGTGAVRWKADAGNGSTRDLLVTATRVYFPTYGTLRVFDRATGRAVASMQVRPEGDVIESAAADDGRGRIYVTVTKAAQSFDEP